MLPKIYDCYMLISDLADKDIQLSVPFVVEYPLETLPGSKWLLGCHHSKPRKELSSKANLVEEKPKSQLRKQGPKSYNKEEKLHGLWGAWAPRYTMLP